MSFRYAHIAQRVFNAPLLYDERKAEAFLQGLGGRIAGDTIVIANPGGGVDHVAGAAGRPLAGKVGSRLERAYTRANLLPFDMVDNVAIIPIEGSLVHKGGWIGSNSGETSYQGLQAQVAMARQSRTVRGVVFEVDSFGGEVNGAFETAAGMAALSREKPTLAVLTDYAYSAGYLLASQARSIVMPKYGGAGSIGVIMIHADYSGMLEQAGVHLTIIRAGKKKADGNPYEPLNAALAERWQAQAEAMRQEFAEVVAKGRRGRITKAKALATEAGTYDAAEAVAAGLADAVGDPLEAFDAFLTEVNRS
jgi:signal peptide peptidase SppA